jgi:hypothetical protein
VTHDVHKKALVKLHKLICFVISAVTPPLFKLWRNATVRDKKITKKSLFFAVEF